MQLKVPSQAEGTSQCAICVHSRILPRLSLLYMPTLSNLGSSPDAVPDERLIKKYRSIFVRAGERGVLSRSDIELNCIEKWPDNEPLPGSVKAFEEVLSNQRVLAVYVRSHVSLHPVNHS